MTPRLRSFFFGVAFDFLTFAVAAGALSRHLDALSLVALALVLARAVCFFWGLSTLSDDFVDLLLDEGPADEGPADEGLPPETGEIVFDPADDGPAPARSPLTGHPVRELCDTCSAFTGEEVDYHLTGHVIFADGCAVCEHLKEGVDPTPERR